MIMHKTPLRTGLLLALPCLALTAQAGILINLDATSLPLGPLPTWTNTGTVDGGFTASGVAGSDFRRRRQSGHAGRRNAIFTPDRWLRRPWPGSIPSRSIEVWAFNPSVAD